VITEEQGSYVYNSLVEVAFEAYTSRGYPHDMIFEDILAKGIPAKWEIFDNLFKQKMKEHRAISKRSEYTKFKQYLGTK